MCFAESGVAIGAAKLTSRIIIRLGSVPNATSPKHHSLTLTSSYFPLNAVYTSNSTAIMSWHTDIFVRQAGGSLAIPAQCYAPCSTL
jgi:hypothetical protein